MLGRAGAGRQGPQASLIEVPRTLLVRPRPGATIARHVVGLTRGGRPLLEGPHKVRHHPAPALPRVSDHAPTAGETRDFVRVDGFQ